MPISSHSVPSPIPSRIGTRGLPTLSRDLTAADSPAIHIGLVNNMPSAALRATERQFRSLLSAASEGMQVQLSLYALPDVPRTDDDRHHMARRYANIDDLWSSRLDGLIVTGAEPLASKLTDEPYWGSLTKLMDWAEQNTHSAVWSCLAAHAALLYLDGIGRRPLGQKLSGVFDCEKVTEDLLTESVPSTLSIPHSRWNDIPEDELTKAGYRILTRSERTGADTFVKQSKSLFVFFQGHPEYDADSLPLEYRRDIRRFLRQERDDYPAMPQGCFDEETVALLNGLKERALADRREEVLADFPVARVIANARNTWRPTAVGFYRNWLHCLALRRKTA